MIIRLPLLQGSSSRSTSDAHTLMKTHARKKSDSPFAPKRTEAQKEDDIAQIAKLMRRGTPLEQIVVEVNEKNAKRYTLSKTQIFNDIQMIEKRWKASLVADMDLLRAQQLAKLDEMESELWQQWEVSKGDEEITAVKTRGKNDESKEFTARKKSRIGHTSIMAQIIAIQERRSKLLGLDAPVKLAGADGGDLMKNVPPPMVVKLNLPAKK